MKCLHKEEAAKKSEFERTEVNTEKTGVRVLGLDAVNPLTKQNIPLFVSDYVLMTYGTGAIMAVPGHDTRDHEFAKVFNLPIVEVVSGGNVQEEAFTDIDNGTIVNSPIIDGLSVKEAKEKISEYI